MDGVQRLVKLLEELLLAESNSGIREIAQRTGISKSAVQRMLTSLEECGWVAQDEQTQSYHIALRLLTLSNAWRLRLVLTRRAAGIMDELCEKSAQTVLLLVPEETKGICQHKVEPERTIKLVADVGKTFPLHAAACGKILLSFAPASLQKKIFESPLESYTPQTLTTPELLREEVKKIRENGYAVSFEEMTPGAAEIAVPLLDSQGNLIAALSIAGLRFDIEGRLSEFRTLLEDASGRILGERPIT